MLSALYHVKVGVAIAISFSALALAARASDAVSSPQSVAIFHGTDQYQLAPRNALVIGVSELKEGSGFQSLKNPRNDADAVTKALRASGFQVNNLSDTYTPEEMTRQNIKKAVYDFGILVKSIGGVGIIYYSGHGMVRNGKTYLFPYDSFVEFDRDFDEELLPIALFYDAFKFAGNPLNIVIIDSCRDDPWHSSLASFGSSVTSETEIKASDNVILTNSTLSGSKALDGTGNLSPYADAFVKALARPDHGLWQVTADIGLDLHGLKSKLTSSEVANTDLIDGRDFVFTPTAVSYNQELETFNNGITTGNRSILEDLKFQYAGGYFYAAADNWLNSSNFVKAPPVPPVKVVQLVDDSNIRTAPSLNAAVVDTPPAGTRFALAGPLKNVAGSNWFPVTIPSDLAAVRNSAIAFVRNDRVRVVPASGAPIEIKLNFSSPSPGQTLGELSGSSVDAIKKAATSGIFLTNSGISIIGYKLPLADGSLGDQRLLLTKQAKVARLLMDLGVDTSQVSIPVVKASATQSDESISIIIK